VISTRRHLEALLEAERRWTNMLFAIAASMVAFLYREINRRQTITEKHEEERRVYVDGELTNLNNESLGHKERSEDRASIGRTIVAVAGLLLTAATVWSLLLAAHVL
jgi:hypothetical protein